MKFDLTKLDYTQKVDEQLKKMFFEKITEMIEMGTFDNEFNRKVTLFHGTSLYHLNSILLYGLVPRNQSNLSNFDEGIKSHESLVYLTNKWHYFYASISSERLKKEKKVAPQWCIPCYVECVLPMKRLVIEEDFFNSHFVRDKIKNCLRRNNPILELTTDECLSQYATVAHLGAVKREDIKSFTLLVNGHVFYQNFVNPNSQYQKDLKKWGQGKGKGKLRLEDLWQLEDNEENLTFWLKDVPNNSIITNVRESATQKYALEFSPVEFEKNE